MYSFFLSDFVLNVRTTHLHIDTSQHYVLRAIYCILLFFLVSYCRASTKTFLKPTNNYDD